MANDEAFEKWAGANYVPLRLTDERAAMVEVGWKAACRHIATALEIVPVPSTVAEVKAAVEKKYGQETSSDGSGDG